MRAGFDCRALLSVDHVSAELDKIVTKWGPHLKLALGLAPRSHRPRNDAASPHVKTS